MHEKFLVLLDGALGANSDAVCVDAALVGNLDNVKLDIGRIGAMVDETGVAPAVATKHRVRDKAVDVVADAVALGHAHIEKVGRRVVLAVVRSARSARLALAAHNTTVLAIRLSREPTDNFPRLGDWLGSKKPLLRRQQPALFDDGARSIGVETR